MVRRRQRDDAARPPDNTVFLAFHLSAVGTFIYSSPGSTGLTDPVGGLVWQNSSANAPQALASDATCGQPRFDRVKRYLYSACAEGDHVRITSAHVNPGQRTGLFYQNVALPKSPGGGGPGHLFPSVATDDAGNVYAAWIDEADSNVYYSYSANQGKSWSLPVKVNAAPATTNEFLWAQAGSKGKLALSWYGTSSKGQPDDFASWFTNPQGSTAAKWFGYVSVLTNANTTSTTAAQQRFTEKPMHYGQICNQGIGCTVSNGDRTMADFFGFSLDHADAMQIVFNDTTTQHHGAHLYAIRQLGPVTLHGKTLTRPVPANPMRDPVGDAQWPHYSPVGAGAEPAAVRLHETHAQPAECRHSAGADDARERRFAPAPRGEDHLRLADAVPGPLEGRFRRGGLSDLLRRREVAGGWSAPVLRRHDDVHRTRRRRTARS